MAITIETFTGDPDGADLIGCFFEHVTGSTTEYHFHDRDGNVVPTKPISFTNGEKFTFDLKKWGWEIKDYDLISPIPGGDWKNNHKHLPFEDDSDGENGTFTAQTGAGKEDKGKTAKAY